MSLLRKTLAEVGLVAASLGIGLAIGAVIARGFGAPPLRVLADMLTSWRLLPDMVAEYAAILTLTALAFAIPLHAGLFNIGAEGSLYLGALLSLWVAVNTGNLALALLAGALAGAALSGVAGVLRVAVGVNEVLSTIMLNWTVYWVMLYYIVTRLADPVFPQRTVEVPESARIPWIEVGGIGIPATLLISVVIAAAVWVFLRMTRPGLLLRAVGANEEAARMRGVPVGAYRLLSMVLAGLLAGLGGALHITGFSYSIDVLGGTVRNYGFNGIGVALVGRNDPLGVAAAALLLSTLMAGSQAVEPVYGVPKEAADLMVGVIVVVLSAPAALRIASRILPKLRLPSRGG